MREACSLVWSVLVLLFQSRASLGAEILILRHQLNIQRRHLPKRLTFSAMDRLIWCRPESGWNLEWRILRSHEGIVSGGKVNWLIDGFCGERLPTIDLAHVDLPGCNERPAHRR